MDSFPDGDGTGPEQSAAGAPPAPVATLGNRKKNRPQRHAFWKAGAIAVFPLLPAIGLAVWTLARLGVGNPGAGAIEALRLTVVFAGPAALITAGGVGRLAAEAGAERGRPHAVWVGARTLGVAGAGLAILAAIPLGDLPVRWPGWTALMVTGLAVGAAGGALIGLIVGGPLPTLTELGVPDLHMDHTLRALRRAGQRARRATRRGLPR